MKGLGALIPIAARLVKGDCLNELHEVCENNKTISTKKLQRIICRLEDELKQEAVYVRNTFDRVSEELKNKHSQ